MESGLKKFVVELLDGHRLMTLATNRADGWPQATIVGYVNEGLTLYCLVSRLSQKYANISRDPRVSAAIGGRFSDPMAIRGLSLAGRATLVQDRKDYDRVAGLVMQRFPEFGRLGGPDPAAAVMLRIKPEVISALDYSKGFGHADQVTVSDDDLKSKISTPPSDWLGRSQR